MSRDTVEGWQGERLIVRSDSLVPGDKVLIRHWIGQCRAFPCRWYETPGIVKAKIPGEPALVIVAVPIAVNAPTSAYIDVGDEVRFYRK